MAKKSTARVQRYRDRSRKNGLCRFEVVIRDAAAWKLRRLAYQRGMEIGAAFERAIDLLESDTGNTLR